MKIWLCVIALICMVVMVAPISVSAQTTPTGEEHQLLPMATVDWKKNNMK